MSTSDSEQRTARPAGKAHGRTFRQPTVGQLTKLILGFFALVAVALVAAGLTDNFLAPWLATFSSLTSALLGVVAGIALAAPLWLATKKRWREGNGLKLTAYGVGAWIYTWTPFLGGGDGSKRSYATPESNERMDALWEMAGWYLVTSTLFFYVALGVGVVLWLQDHRAQEDQE